MQTKHDEIIKLIRTPSLLKQNDLFAVSGANQELRMGFIDNGTR